MKMMKSRFFAMAFLALGVVFATACSKDKNDDNGGGSKGDVSAFVGTYYGSHDIAGLGILIVEDTVTVTAKEGNVVEFFSQKLDKGFDATVNGNRASISEFTSDGITVGADSFSGISVKNGIATLNGNKMNITLNGVTVQEGTVDLDVIGGYPLRNITIKTYAKDPFTRQ